MTFVAISALLVVTDVPGITSSSLLDLPSQDPSANVMLFLGRDANQFSIRYPTPRTVRTRYPALPSLLQSR